jgi:hypothetical protein
MSAMKKLGWKSGLGALLLLTLSAFDYTRLGDGHRFGCDRAIPHCLFGQWEAESR